MKSVLKITAMIWVITLISFSVKAQRTDESDTTKVKSFDYYANSPPTSTISKEEGVIKKGKKLFAGHCSKCHEFSKQKIGPSLSSVTDRRPLSWLLAWIDSSQKVLQQGDPYAQFLYKSYNGTEMPSFKYLSEDDKMAILAYIQKKSAAPTHVAGTSSGEN